MVESSAAFRHSPLITCTFWLLAFCGAAGAQLASLGPTGSAGTRVPSGLCDQPTSCVSLPDRLDLSYEWSADDRNVKTFLVIVPPDRPLQPQVLDAQVDQSPPAANAATRQAAAGTTGVLAQPAEWLNAHPEACGQIFTSRPIGYLRHYRVVQIRVTPEFPADGSSHRIRHMHWTYRWRPAYHPPAAFRDEACRRQDQGFGAILPRLIVNPDALGIYADPKPPTPELPSPQEGLTFNRLAGGKRPTLRLSVDKKALYRLDLRSLASTAKDQAPRLEHMQLYSCGQPVPFYLHHDPSQPGQPPELIFYGVPSDSQYTRTNRYWLAEDPVRKPTRMGEVPVEPAWQALAPEESFPEALVVEQDNDLIIHADNFLTISEFQWVWGEIPSADELALDRGDLGGRPLFTSATFSLPGLVEPAVRPAGQTNFDVAFYYGAVRLMKPARVEIRINDGPLQVFTLQEPGDLTKSLSMPTSELRETSNTIAVRFAASGAAPDEGVYFDRLVAHYRRRFEVTGPPSGGFTFASDPPTSAGWRHYALRGNLPARPLVLDVADTARPRVIQFERDTQDVLHFGQKETHPALYRVLSLDEISTPTSEMTADLADVVPQASAVDYLIISHRDFLDLLDPLVATLRESGWRVRVVDVENVYASFSWGLSGPVAIKAFLAHALQNWPGGGPSYVLLMGDCTSDYRGDFRNDVKNFVPTYTLERGPRAEKWASEHWFTTVCGLDEYCDLILGRLSVNNRKDAKTVIDKIVRYRTQPVLDPWRMTLAYVADHGTFDNDSYRLIERFRPPALIGQRIYLEQFPWEDNFYLPPEIVEADMAKVSPVTTTRILDMFNRGAAFVSYRGHGSPNIWSNERIWFGGDSPNSDILLLRNGERIPFIVNLTCNSGAVDYPDPPWNLCISEDFMRSPTGGAIGLFVPTGPGVPTSHMRLSEELHHVLFNEGFRALGDVVFLTKYRYLLKDYPLEMIKMFLFLGEPSCRLQLPDQTFALDADRPVISAKSGGQVRVSGRSDLGAGQKGVLALFSPQDKERFSAPVEFSPDGQFERVCDLTPTEDAGIWTVRAYCWDEARRRDAVGWATIEVVQPELALTRFEIEPPDRTVHAEDPTTLVCTVDNRSALAVNGAAVEVFRVGRERRLLIDQAPLEIEPKGQQTVRVPWKAEAGFFSLEARLSGSAEVIGQAPPAERRKTLDLAVVGAQQPPAVELSPAPIATQLIRAGKGYSRRSSVSVGCVAAEPVTDISLTLADETGTSETQEIGRLAPGEVRTVQFQRLLERPTLPHAYHVALRYLDNPSSRIVSEQWTRQVRPDDFPDLTILRDQIVFRDEGNEILFHDPTPTDGHTILIDVPVKNTGGAAAQRSFAVEAFDGDPARGGERLRDATGPTTGKRIAFLDPGEVKTVRFRWDPIHNAGIRQIYFRADPSQTVTELDESNNETSRTLRVLAKGKLAAGKRRTLIPNYEQAAAGLRPIGATVVNDGETTIRLVLVEFYAGVEQTPPYKIGEVVLEQIGPESDIEAVLEWKPTPEMLEVVRRERFSFLVRQKGSTRRVTNLPGQ